MRKTVSSTFAIKIACVLMFAVIFVTSAVPGSKSGSRAVASTLQESLAVNDINPESAPNDLDTDVVITGSGFVDTPSLTLGDTVLDAVTWEGETELQATVPWGMEPGVYTLTVENPDGETANLPDAFTVEPGMNTWRSKPINGGAITEIAFAKKEDGATTLYAAGDDTGLFRSKDGGASWDYIFSWTAKDLTVDPTNPERIYMHAPWTIYRSEDEGDTWTALDTSFPYQDSEGLGCAPWAQPHPHPTESGILFAAACGLHKSTDYGESWEISMLMNPDDPRVTDLAFNPDNPDIMVLGTANGNIYVSKNGGDEWHKAANPVHYVWTLVFNPHNPNELWVANDSNQGGTCAVLKSSDPNYDFKNWSDVPPPVDGAWCGYPSIRFSEDIPDRLYITHGTGYFSENGGQDWSEFGPGGLTFSTDFMPITDQPDTVFMADRLYGMHCTQDHGENWDFCNHGITAVAPDHLDVSLAAPDVVFGAMVGTPGIYRGTHGGESWELRLAEEAMAASCIGADPIEAGRVYLGVGDGILITDNGETWSGPINFPIPAEYSACKNLTEVIATHPKQPGMILAGMRHWCDVHDDSEGGIYRSKDNGETWTRMETPDSTANVIDIAHSQQNEGVAFAITANDQFLKSTDNGDTWHIIEIGVDEVMCAHSLAVEPVYPYRIIIAGKCGGPNLFVSQNEGETFEPIPYHQNLGINVRQIEFTPSDPTILYAATPYGLKRSFDSGLNWKAVPGEMGQANITSLKAVSMEDRIILYAGTSGSAPPTQDSQAVRIFNRDISDIQPGVYRYSQTFAPNIYIPMFCH